MEEHVLEWVSIGASAGVAIAAVILAPHVYRIFWPRIITYPWNEEAVHGASGTMDQQRTVVFAASYNPPHYGHLRMLEHLSRRYSKVIAVVGFNPSKKYLVSPEQRADLLREMLKKSSSAGDNVEVVGKSCLGPHRYNRLRICLFLCSLAREPTPGERLPSATRCFRLCINFNSVNCRVRFTCIVI